MDSAGHDPLCTGSFLNWRFTKRLPLIAAWLSCFVAQALLRHWLFGARLESALLPMIGRGVHSIYFLYGDRPRHHTFGHVCTGYLRRAVAFTYGLLMVLHIVFDLFFALSIVCAGRGLAMAIQGLKPKQRTPRLIRCAL